MLQYQTTSRSRASRTIPREVFLTTELTIDGFGADGVSAHESVKNEQAEMIHDFSNSKHFT